MTTQGFIAPIPLRSIFSTFPYKQYFSCACMATTSEARPVRRPENVPGNFYVDTSCIDCDTCRWLAPKTFSIVGGQSAVNSQPLSVEAQTHALRALLACPTGSIRTETPIELMRQAASSFPLSVTGTLSATPVPDVFYNGFSSRDSFGCASWLLIHPDRNPYAIMFDCPRFFRPLAEAIKKTAEPVGGVKYIVLSHRDDVAWHAEWAAALGAERVIHSEECTESQGTDKCEVKLSDGDFPYKLADGAELLHMPGHSVGSITLLHSPSQSLFTGDHLAYCPRLQNLAASTMYCKQSWKLQIESVEKLKDVPFLHGWPGHGRHFHFMDEQERQRKIGEAVEFMRGLECNMA